MTGWEDCTIENRVLRQYRGPGGEVAVPFGVTVIGERAFAGRDDVTRVCPKSSCLSPCASSALWPSPIAAL